MRNGPIIILLGSNIAPRANLLAAVRLLAAHEHVTVRAASRVYQSAPVDAQGRIDPAQDPFLNAALCVETDLAPVELKFGVLRAVEAQLGRVRTEDKFAPRPIDLDIVLYGDLVLDDAENGITLPDPDLLRRAHVALPAADVAPDATHPVTGQRLAEIAASLSGTDLRLADDLDLACAI
ncbi:2-amino-4-hydroxy-6-hydroxymethyldihydropteridine diphosphokinase [Aggregatilinea lenta]|uniref:2-amino-4-hydroxy-6- hydroxymethyldihydropteridine diphosphokinase n=1 Tax=Aggregatilinea lenta TaxID=913108 RepID=UPI0013C2BE5F|nr:2-amino-4-hydroxy-6-hydroxymethyldihydropteridine diphosphokinase [Aggregatilinea lenta]